MNNHRPGAAGSDTKQAPAQRGAVLIAKIGGAAALAAVAATIFNSSFLEGKALAGRGARLSDMPSLTLGNTRPGDQAATTVTTIVAERQSLEMRAIISGSLVAREEVLVGTESPRSARIQSILVEEGDRVREGQVLAVLTSDLDEIALAMNDVEVERANAMLMQSESAIALEAANLELAHKALGRAKPLSRTGITSLDTLEQREADVKVADAKLRTSHQTRRVALAERAIADVKRRELLARLERTRIRAPSSGVVIERLAKRGGTATGEAPLFRILKDGLVEFEALVPAGTVAHIHASSTANVGIPGVEGWIAGTVRQISPVVDPLTRMARVRIALPKMEGLRLGAFARAELPYREEMSVVLPLTAVHLTPDGALVNVVVSGVVERRQIVTGDYSGERIQVRAGLDAGEQVVLRAGEIVRAGTRVNPVPAAFSLASNR